jgi:hypothetical protein
MTIFAIALAIAACIGWTAHTRVLRHALHEAWVEIDALEAERDAKEVHHCVAGSALLTCGRPRTVDTLVVENVTCEGCLAELRVTPRPLEVTRDVTNRKDRR